MWIDSSRFDFKTLGALNDSVMQANVLQTASINVPLASEYNRYFSSLRCRADWSCLQIPRISPAAVDEREQISQFIVLSQ